MSKSWLDMYQEWGKQSGGGANGGRAVAAGALQLWPPALEFGHAALAAAHALTVTLTNTANTTMHLASVAGTTPDFHASFFESKVPSITISTTVSQTFIGNHKPIKYIYAQYYILVRHIFITRLTLRITLVGNQVIIIQCYEVDNLRSCVLMFLISQNL